MTGRDAAGADTPRAAAPTADAGAALLRGGTAPALVAGVLGVAVSALWGGRGAAGFAVGALLAAAALAVGPLLLRASRSASPPAVTAIATGGYAGVVVLLGVAFLALGPVTWLSAGHLAAALVAVTVAGLAGQARAVTRLRVLAFDGRTGERADAAGGRHDGDAAQSSQQAGR